MDSRGTWPPSSQQRQPRRGMLTSPNPNPNPDPAAIMMGGGSTFTSQSSSYHRLPFGALSLPNQHRQAQRPLGSTVFGDGPHFQSQQEETRRPGRPREFSDEHYIVSPLLSVTDSYGGGNSNGGGNANSSDPPAKRGRGRPRGAKRQQLEALGTEGIGFIPHVVKVKPGEDIATKLREFSGQGPRTISIISGTGTVGKVTLRHSSSVTATYEGQYEIVTLAGSFLNCEVNGRMSRIGSLNAALAGNDGRVIGGDVIGELVAATDVQVVVGSFLVEPKKEKQRKSSQPEGSSGQANVNNPFASPRSQGPSCDSSGDNESSSYPLQPPNNVSSSNRGTSYGHSAAQQYHQQQRHQQQQQQQQEQRWQQQRWQPGNNMSSSNRGTSYGHSAAQQYHQQQRQQQQEQQQRWQQQRWQPGNNMSSRTSSGHSAAQQYHQQQRQQRHQQQEEEEEEQSRRGFHLQQSIQMYDLWRRARGL